MATTQQHNKLIGVVFDGNKHLQKVLTNDAIKKYDGNRKQIPSDENFPFADIAKTWQCGTKAVPQDALNVDG